MRTVTEAMRWRRSWKTPDLPCTPVDTAGLHGGVGRSATLLEPLQADGVGTAVLQRAEELLEDPWYLSWFTVTAFPLSSLKNIGPMMPCALSAYQIVTFGDCSDVHGGYLWEGIGSISSGSVCSRYHAGKRELRPTTRCYAEMWDCRRTSQ